VSNTDDHLRNHDFLLTPQGWHLAPAFDLPPIQYGQDLKLHISETDNAPDLDLTREVASYFRLSAAQAKVVLA
jgi:serine/threonine-protein kinase HipA